MNLVTFKFYVDFQVLELENSAAFGQMMRRLYLFIPVQTKSNLNHI